MKPKYLGGPGDNGPGWDREATKVFIFMVVSAVVGGFCLCYFSGG